MTLPGEGAQGIQHNQLIDEAYLGILGRMDQAGWFSAGGSGDDLDYSIGIVRLEGRGKLEPRDAIEMLEIGDEAGNLLPGYEVGIDEETGQLALGYEGPGNERYTQFLEDVIRLGNDLDTAVIEASPYPQALEQWRLRHQTWANRSAYQSLEFHIHEGLKAIRDHVVIKENGVEELLELLRNYQGHPGESVHHDKEHAIAQIETALAVEDATKKDEQLDLALQETDHMITRSLQKRELTALGESAVARAFAREVLIDNPHDGSEPLQEEELDELLAFDNTQLGAGVKVAMFGQILYLKNPSLTPRGVAMLFNEKLDFLGGKSPWEIINDYSREEVQQLYDWAAASR